MAKQKPARSSDEANLPRKNASGGSPAADLYQAKENGPAPGDTAAPAPEPYVPASVSMPEFTWSAVLVGAVLGIIFGASSLYLVLKVSMTVSASIPVAVMSITLFRAFSRVFGMRKSTILENNITQTTGSAGESIAFGVAVTMPALMAIGFDMETTRVMTVGVLGGLLGILMMIPLRNAFMVKQHGELPYPEGTACAEVLIVGETGGTSAKTVFAGFGLAFLYNGVTKAFKLWPSEVHQPLYNSDKQGLPGGVLGADLAPELLGVGYIIGPRISSVTFAGGVLSSLVLIPAIVIFSAGLTSPVKPAVARIDPVTGINRGLIANMTPGEIHKEYILYIGAGAVATGGIISMFRALPLIFGSVAAGLRDLKGHRDTASAVGPRRTERDMPMWFVLVGSLSLVLALAGIPKLGLGLNWFGLSAAAMIVVFGFLFVMVSARLTGAIGSSSNPISGMTVATLLLTCLLFLIMDRTDKGAKLTALTVAAVVCVAASNGGTTAQDLKTGYLVGGTPQKQQWAILVGALSSALVIGGALLALNKAGTIYTKRPEYLPTQSLSPAQLAELTELESPQGEYLGNDTNEYHVLHASEREIEGVAAGRYLVDDQGRFRYLVDPAINGRVTSRDGHGHTVRARDDGSVVTNSFDAPKTRIMALIIEGILSRELAWGLVLMGVLIAVTLELVGISSLPFAVGVFLPIAVSATIFVGGVIRYVVDRLNARRQRDVGDLESSPGILLCSGYIAGGAIAGVVIAFLAFAPDFLKRLDMSERLSDQWSASQWPPILAFLVLVTVLFLAGTGAIFKNRTEPAEERPVGV